MKRDHWNAVRSRDRLVCKPELPLEEYGAVVDNRIRSRRKNLCLDWCTVSIEAVRFGGVRCDPEATRDGGEHEPAQNQVQFSFSRGGSDIHDRKCPKCYRTTPSNESRAARQLPTH